MFALVHSLALAVAAGAALALASPPAQAGAIHTDVPDSVDPAARYLIYMHGAWPETRAPGEAHPTRGPFQYEAIVDGLAARGFEVISELRTQPTNPRTFARKVQGQVEALIARGVPPANIAVAGFSKGGEMALIAASRLRRPDVAFVVMAGCGQGRYARSYETIVANDAPALRGRILSLYDGDDRVAATCEAAFVKATQAVAAEEVLAVGKGHGTFYAADPAWLDKVAGWARGEYAPPAP